MLQGIDRILFRVENVAAATRFWSETYQAIVIRQSDDVAVLTMRTGGGQIVLHSDPDWPDEGIYFLVDDVRALFKQRESLRLRFVGPPTKAARGYQATVKDPFGLILMLIDRTLDAVADQAKPSRRKAAARPESEAVAGAAHPRGVLFADAPVRGKPDRKKLIAIYSDIARTADDLPYTAQFEQLFERYIKDLPDPQPDHAEVWRHLLTTRKAGQLPKLGVSRSKPPELAERDRDRLTRMLGDAIGRRDRLPYTPRFEHLVEQFNKTLQSPLTPHQCWRVVASLAK